MINCLPYIFNTAIISLCSKHNKHYLGLTEDYLSLPVWDSDALFLPQCGIAPGIVSIIAQNLMDRFELVKNVKMRVGALPRFTNSKLKYAWTWNSHGLVNEYYKPAKILRQGKVKQVESFTEIENVDIDIKSDLQNHSLVIKAKVQNEGKTGVEIIREIIIGAPSSLTTEGLLALEFGLGQAEQIVSQIEKTGMFNSIMVHRDLNGRQRVVTAQRN